MTTKEAVKAVVKMAQDKAGTSEGEALELVLVALRERDALAVALEAPVRIMTAKLEAVL